MSGTTAAPPQQQDQPQPRLRLLRGVRAAPAAPDLDPEQHAAVTHRGGPLRLLGAPGTGVTTTLVEAVVDRVERDGLSPDEVLVLAPTRLAAADLRERIAARLARTAREPIARTPASLAFGILRRAAVGEGLPAPRLLSGPEQDVVLRELLAGHAAGAGRAPDWPDSVRAALGTRGLRSELRDLLMRAVERGLGPDDLADLGRSHGRPEWVAAAQVLSEYDEVTALGSPGAYDPALIVGAAARMLAEDPDLLAEVRRSARFVAVDDAQEMTPAVAGLLAVVAGRGGDLLLAGDPDATTLGFRGADPGALADRADDFAAPGTTIRTVVLRTCWRHGPHLRDTVQRVAGRIGAAGSGAHRRAAPATGLEPGQVGVHLLRSGVEEAAYIAGVLRRAHLRRGLRWSQMAVIVRGSGRAATMRRVLSSAGVPVHVPATEVPVRDESAVAPLLDAFEASLDPASLDVDRTLRLLTSSLGGADAVALRRLRRALRAEDRAGGGGRASDDLLVEAVAELDRVATLPTDVSRPARRVARVLAAGRAAAARAPEADGAPRFAAGVTAETMLWAIWDASRLAEHWRRTALGGGAAGARADRDLDAVVALFDAAARFVDRLPQAGPAAFVEHLRGQEVPGDTLVERAPADEAVSLLTPQGAAGREWALVVVAGVQVGVWPDTRLRGSLLGSQALVDVLAGHGDGSPAALRSAQAAIRHEELRLFHVAVSRSTETLLVTAVSGDDEQPSGLVELVSPLETVAGQGISDSDDHRPATRLPRNMSLAALTARMRQVLEATGGVGEDAEAAATGLALLAEGGVPGADPSEWHGLADLSDDRPLVPPGELVHVSPSRVEGFDKCGLRWLLETSGGRVPAQLAQSVGNLVHEIARDLPAASAEELAAELERRWPRLGLPSGWVADQQRSRAIDMTRRLATYYARMDDEGRELVDVERAVSVTIGRAVVSGQVDRLERTPEGGTYIVDLKTGRTQVSDEDVAANPQLGIYQLAIQAGGFASESRPDEDISRTAEGGELVMIGVPRVNLPVKRQPPLPAGEGDPDTERSWARALLDRVSDGMAGADYVAQQGPHCRNCPVRTSCPVQPEGRAVTG